MSDFTTYLCAFLIGGAFCVVAQILIDKTMLTPARILVLYVSVGVLLGALGVYDKLIGIAGCGAPLPLCGFFKGGFPAAAAGTSAALIFGYLSALLFRGKPKK